MFLIVPIKDASSLFLLFNGFNITNFRIKNTSSNLDLLQLDSLHHRLQLIAGLPPDALPATNLPSSE